MSKHSKLLFICSRIFCITHNILQKCFIIYLSLIYIFCVPFGYCDNIDSDPNPSKSRCFPDLGCIVYGADWYDKTYRPVNELPLQRHTINTQFLLYSHNKQETNEPLVTEIVSATPSTIKISSYDRDTPLRLLIHDFTSNGYTGWIKHLARALLEKKPIAGNVISVDWEAGAEPPYIQAIGNARLVTLEIVQFMAMLHDNYDLDYSRVHLIGHGVGAHIAGYVGKALRVDGLPEIAKITALDPNGPYFERMPSIVRLDVSDAEFVEVIHTDAHPEGQGIMETLGHTDFYPNNGYAQPGCNVSDKYPTILKLTRDSIKPGDIYPGCSHKRSFKYYIESIRNPLCSYIGFHCSNYSLFLKGGCTTCEITNVPQCAVLGLDSPNNDSLYRDPCSTTYYFRTGSADTFCLDIYKFTLHFAVDAKTQCELSGYFDVNLTSSSNQLTVNILSNEYRKSSQINQCRGNYTFLGWAEPPPTLNRIGSAVLKWTHIMSMTMTKKIPVQIYNITVTHITTNTRIENELCPEKTASILINSGDQQRFRSCSAVSVGNDTLIKPIVNDSESNIADTNLHIF